MRYILPILTAGCVVLAIMVGQGTRAQSPANKQVTTRRPRPAPELEIVGAEAQALVENAVALLEDRASITARLRCRAELHGQPVIGAGTYVQGPTRAGLLRWEMSLRIGDESVSLQQFADGHTLWTKRDIDGHATIEHVDLAQLPSDRPQRMPVTSMPLAGGLPETLRGMRRAFDFSVALPVRLGERQAYAVRGDWRPAALVKLLPAQAEAINNGGPVDLTELPSDVPDHVVLFLGADDLFPYRIDYRRQRERPKDSGETATLFVLEWLDVQFDERVNPAMFAFDPGDAKWDERTARFLETVRRWP